MVDSEGPQDILSGDAALFLLGNIPGHFRSYHLRAYFSHLIEEEAFKCFHFRHRPEYHRGGTTTSTASGQELTTNSPSISSSTQQAETCCCILLVKDGRHREELVKYNGCHWTNMNDDILKRKVKLQPLSLAGESNEVNSTSFDKQLILSLPELHPPGCMPQGNVGTSIKVFRELIRTCRLPPRAIKKLKLVFPSSLKRYGAVPLDYGPHREGMSLRDMTCENEKKKERTTGGSEDSTNERKRKKKITDEEEEQEEKEQYGDNDDYDAEDWERYEALHNDVNKQERTGERLFEEELEVVWDKGSSGLVFYTDASYWDQMDNAGDFDEKCSQEDDWDVDMSLYYGYESADKAAMDMRDMEIERRLRAGEDLQDIVVAKKHPKENYGSKLMKEKGWKEGTGLGRTSSGISTPIEAEGQSSHCKTGLGYRGEKLVRKPQKKRTREVLIPTVYDTQDEEKDTIIQTAAPTTMKYRKM